MLLHKKEDKVKVAFLGTQSTGKTKRAKAYSKKNNLLLVTGAARSCPLPINLQASRAAQIFIFATQIEMEIEQSAISDKYAMDGIVCDRSLLDPLVYSLDRGFGGLVELLLPFTRKWMETYDKLYWCRPAKGSSPKADGVRCSNLIWQTRIDRRFEAFIKDILCLNVETIDNMEL